MPNEADLADQTIELELRAQLAAVRKQTGPQLEALGFCHNCGEKLEKNALFCSPIHGAGLSECQQDYEHRTRRLQR